MILVFDLEPKFLLAFFFSSSLSVMSILLQKAVLVKMTVNNTMSMISSLDAHGVVRSVVTVTLTVIVNVVTFLVKNIVN